MGMQEKNFKEQLEERVKRVEEILGEYLPVPKPGEKLCAPETIIDAMNYSVRAGGKRLRPILLLEMYRIFSESSDREPERKIPAAPFAAAMEMIHTYSLVHDDLPAMDNDEYRRGKKTTWAVYGDGMGILAGDALLNYAFETAAAALTQCRSLEDHVCAGQAMKVLAENAGIYGMIGGQVADVEGERKQSGENAGQQCELSEEELLYIHTHKTGALINAAMQIGAILAGEHRPEVLGRIERCAMDVGVAFQIQDDILDVIGDSEKLGKPVGSDAANGKTTYVTLKGIDEAKREVERLSGEAISIVQTFPGDYLFMEELIRHLIDRNS